MNMFLHELKAYRKSTIIWTSSLVTLVVFLLSLFPAFSKEAAEFSKMLEGYPEALRKALGLTVESLSSFLGFYSFTFLYITLCGAMQAMNLGTSIVSKEVREKTADFLLTKPVTRTKIMTSKLLAAFTSLLITNVVYIAAAKVMASIVEKGTYSTKVFIMLSVTLFFLQLIFLALGVITSVMVPKIKSVLPISLSTVFGLFFVGALAATSGEGALRYISPFKYFDTAYIMKNSSYEASFIIVGIGFIIAAITASYFLYDRKDVHAV
jgi:ABC-2 type transport system permease protein